MKCFLITIFEGRTLANISLVLSDSSTLNAYISGLAEVNGTVRTENDETKVSLFLSNFWYTVFSASVDVSIKDNGNEVIEMTKTVVKNKAGKVFATSESNSVVDRNNRSLTVS